MHTLRRFAAVVVTTGLVLGLHVPASHAGSIHGAGTVAGNVYFGGSVPPAGSPCRPTSFSFYSDTYGGQVGVTAGTMVNTIGVQYVGPLRVWGNGGSSCEGAAGGTGDITVYASGVNALGGTLGCGPLNGIYLREGTSVVVIVSGQCAINTVGTGGVNFFATGEFVPTEPGEGATSSVTRAAFATEFHVIAN